ncbi:MAG TPA: fluoride efflux transporter CrcB [bacterium]|nr:fluoride efflux transporter CrcB [bacterium]
MEKLVWISLGGLLGAWSRYYLGLWAVEKWGNSFAVGVLLINIVGSFVMAWAMIAGGERAMVGPNARLFLTVGFCACFTTFSTFSWDTYRYFSEGNFRFALLNIFLNVAGCLLGTWGGVVLARVL